MCKMYCAQPGLTCDTIALNYPTICACHSTSSPTATPTATPTKAPTALCDKSVPAYSCFSKVGYCDGGKAITCYAGTVCVPRDPKDPKSGSPCVFPSSTKVVGMPKLVVA